MTTLFWVAVVALVLIVVWGAGILWAALTALEILAHEEHHTDPRAAEVRKVGRDLSAPRVRTALIWSAVAALIFIAASAASAAPVKPLATPAFPHQLQQAERDALISIYVRTRMCMSRANQAMLRMNVTDQEALLIWSKSQCGSGLRLFLVSTARWSPADADRIVDECARRELVITLGVPLI